MRYIREIRNLLSNQFEENFRFKRRERGRKVLVVEADLQRKLVSGMQRGNVFTKIWMCSGVKLDPQLVQSLDPQLVQSLLPES